MALPRVSSKLLFCEVALSAQTGTESMMPKARVYELLVSIRSQWDQVFEKITYVDNSLERAEDSGNGAEEDTLQKTRLANDNLEQVLVNDNKLQHVRAKYVRSSGVG